MDGKTSHNSSMQAFKGAFGTVAGGGRRRSSPWVTCIHMTIHNTIGQPLDQHQPI